jgi:hypothetical protein
MLRMFALSFVFGFLSVGLSLLRFWARHNHGRSGMGIGQHREWPVDDPRIQAYTRRDRYRHRHRNVRDLAAGRRPERYRRYDLVVASVEQTLDLTTTHSLVLNYSLSGVAGRAAPS